MMRIPDDEYWEFFCDGSYYDLWCVRRIGEAETGSNPGPPVMAGADEARMPEDKTMTGFNFTREPEQPVDVMEAHRTFEKAQIDIGKLLTNIEVFYLKSFERSGYVPRRDWIEADLYCRIRGHLKEVLRLLLQNRLTASEIEHEIEKLLTERRENRE